MAGISSNALKGMNYVENRKKYNGIEFTEDLDLDVYDAQLRNLDPQIGRWNQVDPKTEDMEMWSPYASNYDNPIRYNDFLGDEPDEGGPGTGALPAVGITFLQKMDENLNSAVDEAMGALGDVGVSLGGLFNGMNQAASFGKYPSVSADQFGFNDRQTALYNKSTTVGALAPSILPGGKPGESPALAPVNGKPFQVLPYKVGPVAPQSKVNANEANPGKQSKVEKSTTTENIGNGKYTKTTEVRPGKGPGQSRAEYIRYKNQDGKVIKTQKLTYDRANNFQHKKPLRGGPEGRPQNE